MEELDCVEIKDDSRDVASLREKLQNLVSERSDVVKRKKNDVKTYNERIKDYDDLIEETLFLLDNAEG